MRELVACVQGEPAHVVIPGYEVRGVGETNMDLKALIGAAVGFLGPGILVPASNTDFFNRCLDCGLRVVELLSLMTIGLYNQPAGSYLLSILH